MHAFRSHSPRYGGFRAPVEDSSRPAGEHHEHSGRRQPALQPEAMFCDSLNWALKPAQGAHHLHQRGSADPKGRASSASAGFGEGGRSDLCCPPVGAAPRIGQRSVPERMPAVL